MTYARQWEGRGGSIDYKIIRKNMDEALDDAHPWENRGHRG